MFGCQIFNLNPNSPVFYKKFIEINLKSFTMHLYFISVFNVTIDYGFFIVSNPFSEEDSVEQLSEEDSVERRYFLVF